MIEDRQSTQATAGSAWRAAATPRRLEIEEAFLARPLGKVLATLPGIGPRTGARILVLTHRLGSLRHCYDGTRPKDVSMDEMDWLAERFESHRTHLRGVAYQMLGSLSEADDAVQESWLRLSRSGTSGVKNLGSWLTTVVARVCLDMLRSRKLRREEPLDVHVPDPIVSPVNGTDPEHEALLAESVGLALLVVLDTLAPAERLAFVLHDMFDLPFDEIAPIVGRSPNAARLLASRARRRVRGAAPVPDADLTRQQELVGAFLAASRGGDFDALLAVLDPEVVLRADIGALGPGGQAVVRGAAAVADQALTFTRFAWSTELALVNGAVGLVTAPGGQPLSVMGFTISHGKIAEIYILADPERLRRLDLAVLDN